eukprot:2598580-Rhodomonas_salina.4
MLCEYRTSRSMRVGGYRKSHRDHQYRTSRSTRVRAYLEDSDYCGHSRPGPPAAYAISVPDIA